MIEERVMYKGRIYLRVPAEEGTAVPVGTPYYTSETVCKGCCFCHPFDGCMEPDADCMTEDHGNGHMLIFKEI